MKKLCVFAVVLLSLPFVLVGCGKEENVPLNCYSVEAVFDEESATLTCDEKITYFNSSANSLKEVCLFLYANSFTETSKSVTKAYLDKAYKWGESYGNITFDSVKVNGTVADFEISENQNILTVQTEEFFPGESVLIDLHFTLQLAKVRHRLGAGEHAYNFGNFLPMVCVYDNGFVTNDFSPYGDPFYSEISNFDVRITYPVGFVLASTGKVVSTQEGEAVVSVVKAKNVRDFAFVLSREFSVLSDKVGQATVNYFYYDDENAQAHLKTSLDALSTFNQLFGEYPYEVLNVVKTDFCFGGMEEPNLVMIADDLPDEETINYVIVHEIAHQWWYGVVGNNQFDAAWVDEGLTEFSSALFFEKNKQYGLDYQIIMQNSLEGYLHFRKIYIDITGKLDETMTRNLNQFDTEPEYVNITYTRGMLMFDFLRQTMSERKFAACLKDYYKAYKFKNSSPEKLVESFCKSSRTNLEGFFDAWLGGKVVFENFSS